MISTFTSGPSDPATPGAGPGTEETRRSQEPEREGFCFQEVDDSEPHYIKEGNAD